MAEILVTGAGGQLGMCIRDWCAAHPGTHNVVWTDVAELDITDPRAVETLVDANKTDFIINCAAYTAVDKAEQDADTARRVNAGGPGVLARAAAKSGAALVHISTDYVFDGQSGTPYRETDATAPLGVYGLTKLDGERQVAASGCLGAIVRTAWLYSEYGNNFVKTMLRLGAERSEVRVVADQWGAPTYAGDLAAFIMEALLSALSEKPLHGEVYHYSDVGTTTWHGFAAEVMRLAGLDCRVVPCTTDEYPTAARRPRYSLLDKSKAIEDFGITIPAWESSLAGCVKKLITL